VSWPSWAEIVMEGLLSLVVSARSGLVSGDSRWKGREMAYGETCMHVSRLVAISGLARMGESWGLSVVLWASMGREWNGWGDGEADLGGGLVGLGDGDGVWCELGLRVLVVLFVAALGLRLPGLPQDLAMHAELSSSQECCWIRRWYCTGASLVGCASACVGCCGLGCAEWAFARVGPSTACWRCCGLWCLWCS